MQDIIEKVQKITNDDDYAVDFALHVIKTIDFITNIRKNSNIDVDSYVLKYEVLTKYIRIYVCHREQYNSGYGFIDLSSGNILKMNSWKVPEKKNPRGNIFNYKNASLGQYGVSYIR